MLKLNARQVAHNVSLSILKNIVDLATGVKRVLDKGVDERGQKLPCSPDDIRKAWTPEQKEAVTQFIATFGQDETPVGQTPPKPSRKRKA